MAYCFLCSHTPLWWGIDQLSSTTQQAPGSKDQSMLCTLDNCYMLYCFLCCDQSVCRTFEIDVNVINFNYTLSSHLFISARFVDFSAICVRCMHLMYLCSSNVVIEPNYVILISVSNARHPITVVSILIF